MSVTIKKLKVFVLTLGVIMLCSLSNASAVSLPDPAVDATTANQPDTASIVVAGGCFWGVQAVFQHVKGVKQAVSGYAGGDSLTARYNAVSSGMTGHAESVEVTYNPKQVTLGQLLKVYFSVAHDPTELNHQGPDHGTQYRSAIFYSSDEEKKVAEAYIKQLNEVKAFDAPIVTTLEPLKKFYKAEDYHQDYARLNPDNPYIRINDAPKLVALQKELPELYTAGTP